MKKGKQDNGKGKDKDRKGHELYVYRAAVKRVYEKDPTAAVYDADTIHVLVDHGFGVFSQRILRLARIDAPEMRGEERDAGIVARDVLRSMILGREVIIHTQKDTTGSYARYLAEVFVEIDGEVINVNDYLLENGYAVPYEK